MAEGEELARLRALVAEAAARPAGERAAFLARAAPEPALRREAEELLALGLVEDGFLAGPAPASVPELPRPGAVLGGFRLLGLLGQGGMGTVYEAEQLAPRRRVALKVVRAGLAGPAARARFVRESELLARLRHPGIAAVHASGIEGEGPAALPWYALELVEGARTLTEHARGLALRARVALLAEVADAVHHGHLKGVVHRDLKPANVLVDGAGRPRVIDFGIARALDGAGVGEEGTLATRPGELLGSLEGMSPEQLGPHPEEVDARSDVWALGVLLYELLCDRPPFPAAGQAWTAVARRIQEEPPPRPRALVPGLDRELEHVVLCALEKDPARRYASAAALRADLLAWLDGRAIAARPPSLAYAVRVLARRHRAAVLALAAGLVAALGATGISLVAAARARDAEALAARRFDETRALARALLFELHDAIAGLAGATEPRRTLVATALEYLDALEAEAGAEPELLAELAEGRLRLAEILGAPGLASLGDVPAARREAERALALSARLLALAPEDPAARALSVRARALLGNLVLAAGAPDEARELLQAAVAEADALAAAADASPARARLPALTRTLLARALEATGERELALTALAEAIARTRAELARGADDELERDLVIQLERRGGLLAAAGELAAAREALTEGLERAEARLARRPADAQARQDVAHLLEALGRARGAEEAARARAELERSVALGRAQVAADPADWKAHQSLSIALESLGALHFTLGDAATALGLHEEARALSRRALAASDGPRERHAVAVGDTFVGQALAALGRWAEAREALASALATHDELLAEGRAPREGAQQRAEVLSELAALELALGAPEAALALAEELERAAGELAARAPASPGVRRLTMLAQARRGLAHQALGADESLATPARGAHLRAAETALALALDLHAELEERGLALPSDEVARARTSADLEACRAARAELEGP